MLGSSKTQSAHRFYQLSKWIRGPPVQDETVQYYNTLLSGLRLGLGFARCINMAGKVPTDYIRPRGLVVQLVTCKRAVTHPMNSQNRGDGRP